MSLGLGGLQLQAPFASIHMSLNIFLYGGPGICQSGPHVHGIRFFASFVHLFKNQGPILFGWKYFRTIVWLTEDKYVELIKYQEKWPFHPIVDPSDSDGNSLKLCLART